MPVLHATRRTGKVMFLTAPEMPPLAAVVVPSFELLLPPQPAAANASASATTATPATVVHRFLRLTIAPLPSLCGTEGRVSRSFIPDAYAVALLVGLGPYETTAPRARCLCCRESNLCDSSGKANPQRRDHEYGFRGKGSERGGSVHAQG